MNKRNLLNLVLLGQLSAVDTIVRFDSNYTSILPEPPFYMTISPPGQLSTPLNSEIVLVTQTDYGFVIVERGKKGTDAKQFENGAIMSSGIYAETAPAIGDIVMTLNAAPTSGRLFMNGGTHNKSDFPLLYEHVKNNSAYGIVTSTTFTLADMRQRFPLGLSDSGTGNVLGSKGGFERTRHVNTLWGIAAGAFRQSGTKYLNSIKPLLDQWLTGDGSSSELTYKSSVANAGGVLGQEGDNPIERLWYEYTSSNMPPYIVVNYEVVAG